MELVAELAMRGRVEWEVLDAVTKAYVRGGTSNVITVAHRQLVAGWLAGQDPAVPDYIALGTGAPAKLLEANQDTDIELTSSGANQQLAQGFQLDESRAVNAVLFQMRRLGTSPGSVFVDIYTDAGGFPDVLVASSAALAINGFDTTLGLQRFVLDTPITLAGGVQYHAVIRTTGYTYANGVTEVGVGADTSSATYADGAASTYNGSAWSAYSPAGDLVFRVTVAPDLNYETIVDEVERQQLTSKTVQGTSTARLLASFTQPEGNGRHGMIGLFNASAAGILSAAAAVDIVKDNTQVLNIYWLITVN